MKLTKDELECLKELLENEADAHQQRDPEYADYCDMLADKLTEMFGEAT